MFPPPPRTKPSIFTRVSSSPLCSLRKQPTFLDHWFPREITSEKRAQKFHTDECQYLDLGSASDCSCRVGNLLQPIGSGCWRVICMEFLRRHLAGKPVVAQRNVGCFLRLDSVRKTKRPRRRQCTPPPPFKNLVRRKNSHPLTLRPTLIGRAAGHLCCCSVEISIFIWCKFKKKGTCFHDFYMVWHCVVLGYPYFSNLWNNTLEYYNSTSSV